MAKKKKKRTFMKILVFSQYFYPEVFRINEICSDLVARGHEVTVVTAYPQYPQGKIYDGYGFNKPYEKYYNGVKIERVKTRPRGKTPLGLLLNCYTYVKSAKKWVKKCKEKFDVVYVYQLSPVTVGLPAVEYKKKFNVPIVFNILDLWPESVETVLGVKIKPVIKYLGKMVNRLYAASDVILCTSESFKTYVGKRETAKNKCVYLPQFYEKPNFNGVTAPDALSKDTFNVVFAGNIGNAQGLDLLADTAKILKNEGIRFYLVGDGRAKEELTEKVKAENLSDDVLFIGRVAPSEADRFIRFADCAYLSLKPNKILEMTIPAKLQTYLACGAPVLCVNDGESAKLITESGAGITAEQNAESVKTAILCLKNLSDDKKEEMRENAVAFFDKNFDKRIVMDKLEAILKDVAEKQ